MPFSDRLRTMLLNALGLPEFVTELEQKSDTDDISRDGTQPPTADTPWNTFKITNLGTPTAAADAATKAYADSLISGGGASLHLNGDNSPTADISWGSRKITSLASISNGASTQLTLNTDGTSDLRVDATSQVYKLTPFSTTNSLGIQSQTVGTNSFIALMAKDGDATDEVSLYLLGKGTPSAFADTEALVAGYDPVGAQYRLLSYKTNGGTLRPLSFATGNNVDQLKLNTDGSLTVSGATGQQVFKILRTPLSANILGIEGQTSGVSTVLSLFSKDGDGTDDTGIRVYALGNATAETNREFVEMKWQNSLSQFFFRSFAGGTGTLRPIAFSAFSGSSNQLTLNTDGSTSLIGDLKIVTIGKGVQVKTGSNAKIGQATLVAGTVTVSNTSVTANSRIQLSVSAAGGTQGFLSHTKSVGASFTINSTSVLETSTIDWEITESIA